VAAGGGATAHHNDSGQGIVEYGLILGLSAAVTIVVLVFLGGTLSDVLEIIGRAIDAATRAT
jgi:Flp pilus assembly pilin Flp